MEGRPGFLHIGHVVPAHCTLEMHSAYAEMAEDTGYEFGETVHILRNGQELSL